MGEVVRDVSSQYVTYRLCFASVLLIEYAIVDFWLTVVQSQMSPETFLCLHTGLCLAVDNLVGLRRGRAISGAWVL